jgi:hypothetical protein
MVILPFHNGLENKMKKQKINAKNYSGYQWINATAPFKPPRKPGQALSKTAWI